MSPAGSLGRQLQVGKRGQDVCGKRCQSGNCLLPRMTLWQEGSGFLYLTVSMGSREARCGTGGAVLPAITVPRGRGAAAGDSGFLPPSGTRSSVVGCEAGAWGGGHSSGPSVSQSRARCP